MKKHLYETSELLEDSRVSISNFIKKIMATKTWDKYLPPEFNNVEASACAAIQIGEYVFNKYANKNLYYYELPDMIAFKDIQITVEKFKVKLNNIINDQLGNSSIVLISDRDEDIETGINSVF